MSMLSDLQSKKIGVFDLLAMGFGLYLQHFRSFASIFCVLLLPFLVFIQVATLHPPTNIVGIIATILFYVFYFIFVIPVYTVVFAVFTEEYVMGNRPQLNTAMKHIWSRVLPLTGLNIKFSIIGGLRTLLLIIPGLIYYVNNVYYSYAFILRGQQGKSAFQYSRMLVKGSWWKVWAFFVVGGLVAFGLNILIGKILAPVIPNAPTVVAIVSNTVASLFSLWVGIGGVLLFLNLDFQKR